MSLSTLGRFALVVSIPALVVACTVDSSPAPLEPTSGGGSVPTGSATTPPSEDAGAASEFPILAPIDTNQTMTAAPGQGVGVFTEYDTGGVAHLVDVRLASSTRRTPCQFDVKVSVQSGAISGPGDAGLSSRPTRSRRRGCSSRP